MQKGIVFDIQRYSSTNGPGIRSTAFLKGCPLHCLWCHNPESYIQKPQLMYREMLCKSCGTCVYVCPKGVHTLEGKHLVNIEKCIYCGVCADHCAYGALKISGLEMSSEELAMKLTEDEPFYRNSGGGVTFSGGEPTMQYEFLRECMKLIKKKNIHIALDTSGFCEKDRFESLYEYVDLFLYDFKCFDGKRHKAFTGQDNELIKENLESIVNNKKKIRIRYPMIPGCNDDEGNMFNMVDYLKSLGVFEIDVSVYHDLGINKHGQLRKDKEFHKIEKYSEATKETKLDYIRNLGMTVHLV